MPSKEAFEASISGVGFSGRPCAAISEFFCQPGANSCSLAKRIVLSQTFHSSAQSDSAKHLHAGKESPDMLAIDHLDVLPATRATRLTLDLDPADLELALASNGTSLRQAVMMAIVSALAIDCEAEDLAYRN
jgi:hypothetical protein